MLLVLFVSAARAFCAVRGQMMWANVELNPSILDATWMRMDLSVFFFPNGDSKGSGSRMGLVAYNLL